MLGLICNLGARAPPCGARSDRSCSSKCTNTDQEDAHYTCTPPQAGGANDRKSDNLFCHFGRFASTRRSEKCLVTVGQRWLTATVGTLPRNPNRRGSTSRTYRRSNYAPGIWQHLNPNDSTRYHPSEGSTHLLRSRTQYPAEGLLTQPPRNETMELAFLKP